MSSDKSWRPSSLRPAPVDRRLTRHLRRVPLFPLPELVLFPHALIPLHIFEPRYREMTAHALATNKLLVLGNRLEAEIPGDAPPSVAVVAGLGEIVLSEDLPDGGYNLVIHGRARVRIEQELPGDEPYRVVSVRQVPDLVPADLAELRDSEASLRALVDGLADAISEGGEMLKQVAAAQDSPAALVNVVAAALISDAAVRQQLLETINVVERMERVSSEVVATTARVGPTSRGN